jgi:large subunit ribosomal protein L24
MKKKFSLSWKASSRPGKQRKYKANAPLHLKRKLLSCNLSKDLRKKYLIRNVPVRKGDTVKILRGKFKKKEGKVTEVYLKLSKLVVEGIQVKKQDGSKANIKLQPSNVQIISLNLDDKKRLQLVSKKIKTDGEKENKKEIKKIVKEKKGEK